MNSEPIGLSLTQEQTPMLVPNLPHLPVISFLKQLVFGDPNSFAPTLFIWWTILYLEMFPPVITNPVSPPPPLPRGTVGFN